MKSQDIADKFERANEEARTFIRSISSDDWKRTAPGEDWPVGVLAHHIAVGHQRGCDFLRVVARGHPLRLTGSHLEQINAAEAVLYQDVTLDDVLTLLDRNAALALSTLRAYSDEDLAQTAAVALIGGRVVPAEALAEALVRHIEGHLASLQRTVGTV